MRVLIAEDETASRRMLSVCLTGWGYEVIAVDNGAAALECLQRPDGPRLALLDWEMPEMDGVDVCAKLRAMDGLPFRYLIVLTGHNREEDVIAALDIGADDHMTKPWTPGELRARLGVGERMIRLYEQLEEQTRNLAIAAQTDYLTQLCNRSVVMERLGEELTRTVRTGMPLSVLMLDIDHFKQVNDSYGHTAGDQVLIEVAKRLKEGCRPYDVVGRYGGEEFLVMISPKSYEDTLIAAQRFWALVGAAPIKARGAEIDVTVSVGGVWLAPGFQSTVDALVNAADLMLYRAKELGRNRVEICAFKECTSESGEKEQGSAEGTL